MTIEIIASAASFVTVVMQAIFSNPPLDGETVTVPAPLGAGPLKFPVTDNASAAQQTGRLPIDLTGAEPEPIVKGNIKTVIGEPMPFRAKPKPSPAETKGLPLGTRYQAVNSDDAVTLNSAPSAPSDDTGPDEQA